MYALFALPLVGDAAKGMRLGQAFIKRASTGRGVAGLAAQGVATGTVQLSVVHGVDWLAGGGANSFAAGTGVVTGIDANGEPVTTPIEQLQVGDVVTPTTDRALPINQHRSTADLRRWYGCLSSVQRL
ncbi:MAG: hypothetical protein ACE37H_17145 [Phycisphaeraceae bacterium]